MALRTHTNFPLAGFFKPTDFPQEIHHFAEGFLVNLELIKARSE